MKSDRFVFLFLLFISCSCRQAKKPPATPESLAAAYHKIDSAKILIKNGDLIFRNGMDAVSSAARSMNRKDTSFSHCGIVFIEQDSVFVYHALGGSYNPSQRLVREPIDSFCKPEENDAFGVYRYHLNPVQLGILRETVTGHYQKGLKFDMYFNFLSDDKMYCSEFVFKSLNRAVDGAYSGYIRLDTLPFGVTTDDLFLHPDCRLVKKESLRL